MNPCPICSDNTEKKTLCQTRLTFNTRFDLVECTACRTKYYYPIPTSKQLSTFYSDHRYKFDRWRQGAKSDYYLGELPEKFARDTFGLNVIHGDLFSAGYADAFFDVIYNGDVLEHVPT